MSRVITQHDIRLTGLRSTDALVVQRWLASFLQAHNESWVEASSLGWSSEATEVQIMATGLVESHLGRLQRSAGRQGHRVQVARAGDRPVGLVWASQRMDDYLRIPVGMLNWVFVAPDARGQGIAGLLVEDAKGWMRDRGLRSCQVHVLADNEPARRLYARAGLVSADVRMMGSLDPREA